MRWQDQVQSLSLDQLWLKIILEDIKIKWERPMSIYCHNKSVINIAHNHVQSVQHVERSI